MLNANLVPLVFPLEALSLLFFSLSLISVICQIHAAILSAIDSQIQGLQSILFTAQPDLPSQIASVVQPENYVLKKKGNEQQFNFKRRVIRISSAAVKALASGNIGKAKEELNEGISLLTKGKFI